MCSCLVSKTFSTGSCRARLLVSQRQAWMVKVLADTRPSGSGLWCQVTPPPCKPAVSLRKLSGRCVNLTWWEGVEIDSSGGNIQSGKAKSLANSRNQLVCADLLRSGWKSSFSSLSKLLICSCLFIAVRFCYSCRRLRPHLQ